VGSGERRWKVRRRKAGQLLRSRGTTEGGRQGKEEKRVHL